MNASDSAAMPDSESRHRPGRGRRPGRRWWVTRTALAIAGGLLLAAAIDVSRGGATAIWLRYGGAAAYVARGERIEIRPGHALYLDCRGEGSPTLVLEAGMGSDSATWDPVHDALAGITRACAYDRTGRGRSDGGSAGDLAGMSRELAALLAAAGEHPPFVLVGHSLGTVIARVHATQVPGEVAGLVLVDGFDPDIFDGRVLPILGPLRDAYAGHTTGLWELVAKVEAMDMARSREQLAAARVVGLPLEVVVAPRAEARLDADVNQRIANALAAGYEALSPGRTTFTVAWGAGHMVQFDRPDLVVEAAGRIVRVVRG